MSKNTKLYIDGQIFQTAARDRGMGRYAQCLIRAIEAQQNDVYSEIVMILSSNIKQTDLQIIQLKSILPTAKILKLDLWTTKGHTYEASKKHNRAIIQKIIDLEHSLVHYFIPALFQEPTVCVYPDGVTKMLLFYDLVPYLYHGRYSPLIPFEDYLKRFKIVFESDIILTISQTVADDLKVYLGVSEDKIVNIDGAAIKAVAAQSRPKDFTSDIFVLMPTSDDPRKNNLRAVLGFEEFRATHHQYKELKLVITSTISNRERDHLSLFSKHLWFTGNLAEEELDWLYANCELVLFVPEYEGLGLPILEAVSEKKKIVCSSISVFREISVDAFYYCDHENQDSIARALHRAFYEGKKISTKKYIEINNHYSWSQTASRFLKAHYKISDTKPKKRIAMFIPTPTGFSAIGKVVAETHFAMQDEFEIDYYVENGLYGIPIRSDYLQYIAKCYPAQKFSAEKYASYDAVIYHIGNGDYHIESIKNALYLPGYIILHDTNLKDAFRVLQEESIFDKSRIDLENLINKKTKSNTSSYLTSLINGQCGVMTHSQYADDAVLRTTYRDGINRIVANLPTATPSNMPWRNSDHTTIGLAGIIADVKGIELIEKIADNPLFDKCSIKLFGFNFASKEVTDRLYNHDNISLSTNISDLDFTQNISKLDIFMNYRTSYNGETSLSTLEAMRQGVAVIVRDIGWYGELPDDVVIKVSSEEEAIDELDKIINDPVRRNIISNNAKVYIQSRHDHKQYVKSIKDLISQPVHGLNHEIAVLLKNKQIKNAKQYLNIINKLWKKNNA
jgi:glycosyltransferase involved in cell wall biosynthesis